MMDSKQTSKVEHDHLDAARATLDDLRRKKHVGLTRSLPDRGDWKYVPVVWKDGPKATRPIQVRTRAYSTEGMERVPCASSSRQLQVDFELSPDLELACGAIDTACLRAVKDSLPSAGDRKRCAVVSSAAVLSGIRVSSSATKYWCKPPEASRGNEMDPRRMMGKEGWYDICLALTGVTVSNDAVCWVSPVFHAIEVTYRDGDDQVPKNPEEEEEEVLVARDPLETWGLLSLVCASFVLMIGLPFFVGPWWFTLVFAAIYYAGSRNEPPANRVLTLHRKSAAFLYTMTMLVWTMHVMTCCWHCAVPAQPNAVGAAWTALDASAAVTANPSPGDQAPRYRELASYDLPSPPLASDADAVALFLRLAEAAVANSSVPLVRFARILEALGPLPAGDVLSVVVRSPTVHVGLGQFARGEKGSDHTVLRGTVLLRRGLPVAVHPLLRPPAAVSARVFECSAGTASPLVVRVSRLCAGPEWTLEWSPSGTLQISPAGPAPPGDLDTLYLVEVEGIQYISGH